MAEFKEFIGSVEVNMDSKGRIVLPVKYRELLGDGFHVTRGYDGCLSVYDKENWVEFYDKLMSYPDTNPAARIMQRKFLSGVEEPVPDKQGKILLSQSLREFAGLTKEVVVAGAGNRVEIWDKHRWEEYNNSGMTIEEAAAQLDGLGLGF